MRKHLFLLIILMVITIPIWLGCGESTKVGPSHPVTLNLWHNYGGQLKDTMDAMIDEFNETTGAEHGIMINVTSISGSATLHEKLTMAAYGDPGAPELPDITTAYPKTALLLAEKGLLVDLNDYFTPQELDAYITEFIREGRIEGDHLYVFPTAKSTEVLFVNTTIFNRFASDMGVRLEDLHSFEGIARTAELYYEWTDQLTPEVAHDGKTFFMPDSLLNYSLIGSQQLGADFIKDDRLNIAAPEFQKVWDYYYKPAILGHVAIFDGYATDLAKTGDIVCSIGSTAGVSFFSPRVTYADNTSEPAELAILPYPVFEGGKKIAIQRGAGMSVINTSPEKAYAAAVFLKWFTSPENNLRFVSSTGYLPVTKEAYGEIMSQEIEQAADNNMKKLLQTCQLMQREYEFFIPPLFEGIDQLQDQYESQLRETASSSRQSYLNSMASGDSVSAYEEMAIDAYQDFVERWAGN
ncbi:MAG TPA: extracellular solute-binding protein [Syntrophomonadaceae bacterium]|nr:extracellular solute-binding protein [Syntrophomonadaceae bacterium]